jgi:hypothetical protein
MPCEEVRDVVGNDLSKMLPLSQVEVYRKQWLSLQEPSPPSKRRSRPKKERSKAIYSRLLNRALRAHSQIS